MQLRQQAARNWILVAENLDVGMLLGTVLTNKIIEKLRATIFRCMKIVRRY